MQFFLGCSLRLALKGQTVGHQRFKSFAALSARLSLCLGHGAEARQPNVFGSGAVQGVVGLGLSLGLGLGRLR